MRPTLFKAQNLGLIKADEVVMRRRLRKLMKGYNNNRRVNYFWKDDYSLGQEEEEEGEKSRRPKRA